MNNYADKGEFFIQIDVKTLTESSAICNIYTGVSCIEAHIKRVDYEYLKNKGFFVRPTDEKDSANIINTTDVYKISVTGTGKD